MRLLALMVVLMALPTVYGLTCSYAPVGLRENCGTILGSDLSPGEQREALGALLAGDSFVPAHDAALEWNRKVLDAYSGGPPPEGVPSQAQGSLQGVWVKILPPTPTVLRQGVLYHNGSGVALLGRGYFLQPYAGTLSGDCRTEYRPEMPQETLRLFASGILQGEGNEVSYRSAGDVTLAARLDVSQLTSADRYRWFSYCCKRKTTCGPLGCVTYCTQTCTECRYRSTETRSDRVLAEDSLELKLYDFTPLASLAQIAGYGGTLQAVFSPDERENSVLLAGREYRSQGAVYSLAFGALDGLTVTAEPQETANRTLLLPTNVPCLLEIHGPFTTKVLPCSTYPTRAPLRLRTDRVLYKSGERIELSIEPQDAAVELEYAGEHQNATGGAVLTAEAPFTRITGRLAAQEAIAVVGVADSSRWQPLWRLLILGLIAAATWSFMRTWLGRRLLWDAH